MGLPNQAGRFIGMVDSIFLGDAVVSRGKLDVTPSRFGLCLLNDLQNA